LNTGETNANISTPSHEIPQTASVHAASVVRRAARGDPADAQSRSQSLPALSS
jgi:hypothetical protein